MCVKRRNMVDDTRATADLGVRWTHRRPFLVFQGVMWSLLGTSTVLPALGLPKHVAWAPMILWVLAWTASGLALSTCMAAVLVRVPESFLRGFRAVALVLPLAVLGGSAWSLVLLLLEPVIGREPFAPPEFAARQLVIMGTVRGSFLLGLWTSLFLVNLLSLRVQRAREQSVHARAAANQAQLQLLRSQINPHFLFNALNSVIALIGENPRGAQTMIRDVATLLRHALDSDRAGDVTVQRELEFVRLYLKCELVRFETRLRVSYEIEEGVEAFSVPPMLLHPLVENAVKHGMLGTAGAPLSIRIGVRRSERRLILEVENTGSLQPPPDRMLPPTSGIGLRNIRDRLVQLFPGEHRFELFERDGWVVAKMELPFREVG